VLSPHGEAPASLLSGSEGTTKVPVDPQAASDSRFLAAALTLLRSARG
jgi:hypothetical protein